MKFFKKPHPFIFNSISVILPGMVAFSVILLFAPLELKELNLIERGSIGLLFGVISSLCVLITVLFLKRLIPDKIGEENWTIGKEFVLILTVILIICSVNFIVIILIQLSSAGFWDTFKMAVLYTFLISIFPVVIMILTEQVVHNRSILNQASKLSESLGYINSTSRNEKSVSALSKLKLLAENGNTELEIDSNLIL